MKLDVKIQPIDVTIFYVFYILSIPDYFLLLIDVQVVFENKNKNPLPYLSQKGVCVFF